MTADSAGLDITGVTAYKATYAKTNASTPDYSKAAVSSKVYMGDGESNTNAQHSGDPLNVPAQGCGYYLMGDETFCVGNGLDPSKAWKYASSIHMLDKTGNNNAYLGGVTLVEDMVIDIMYHTYGKLNSDPNHKTVTINEFTANWATTTLWWQGGSTSQLQTAFSLLDDSTATYSTQITIKTDISGTYDLWLNSSNQLHFVRKGDASSSALAAIAALSSFAPAESDNLSKKQAKQKIAPSPKNATVNVGNYIYLHGKSGWQSLSKVHIWKNGGSDYTGWDQDPTVTKIGNSNTYYLNMNSSPTGYDRMIVRTSSEQTGNIEVDFSKRCFHEFGKSYTTCDQAEVKTFYLATSQDNWGENLIPIPFSTTGDHANRYYLSYTFTAAGEFKLVYDTNTWIGQPAESKTGISSDVYTGSGGNNFVAPGPGTLTIWMTPTVNCYRDKMYIFDGVEGEITWQYASYSVTLNKQGGSGGTNSVTATYGSAMPSASAPSKTGYTFGGYYSATGGGGTQYYTDSMASNTNWDNPGDTLYAKWTAKTATINFNRQDGTGGSNSSTLTYDGANPSINAPTRANYTFGGYYSETGGNGTQYFKSDGTWAGSVTVNAFVLANASSSINAYAKWTPVSYTITIKNMTDASVDGVAVVGSDYTISHTYGTQTLLQGYLTRMTKDGYVLAGFYDNKDFTGNPVYEVSTTDAGNKTYWAKWLANAGAAKLYIYNETNNWTGVTVNVTVGGSSYDQRLTTLTVDPYTGVYYLVYPSAATQIYVHNGYGSSGQQNRTPTISLSSSTEDSYGNARGTQDAIYVHSADDGSPNYNRKWAWSFFPGFADPGYYVVGSKNFSGASGALNWSYSSAVAMTALTTNYYECTLSLDAGDEFQIWHATASNNRADIYGASEIADDDETELVLEAHDSNLRVIGESGKYNVFIDVSDANAVQISITDAYAATYAVFSDGTKAALMKGDGTYNTDVLESGVDISQGTSFVIYKRSQGETVWITGDADGFNPSDPSNAKFAEKTASTSKYSLSYDDIEVETDDPEYVYGVKVKLTGTYTIYVSGGKIYLASVPKENGYFLLHDGGNKGFTSATEFLTINNSPAEATDYVAQYSNYIPTSGETAEIHSYNDGKDVTYSSFSAPGLASSVVSWSSSTITFGTTPLNIYIQKNGTVVFEQASVDMLTMNSFDKAQYLASGTKEAFIKNANTTLVLAVEFSVSKDFANNVEVVCTGGNNKIRFTAFAFLKTNKVTTLDGHTPYSYMRANKYSGWANCTGGSSKSIGEVTSDTTYIVLIMIDYNPNTIDETAINSWVSPNASFALKAAQS